MLITRTWKAFLNVDFGLPWGLRTVKNLQWERSEFDPWVGRIPWRREWQPTPIFLPGEFHGQRSLAGYNPWVSKQLDTAECNNVLHVLTPWSPHRIFFKHFNISFLPCAIIACLCAPHTLPFSPHLHPFILLMSIILHRATYTSPPPGNLPRFPKLVPLPMQLYSPCSLYVSFIVSMAIVTPYLILSSNV